MSKPPKIIEVEALSYADTLEYQISRHFRNRPVHRAEDSGVYNVQKMIEAYGDKLVRSRQEFVTSPSGLSSQLLWASLCFDLEKDLFVVVIAKGSTDARGRGGEEEFKITVTADTPQRAADMVQRLRKEFTPKVDHHGPGFFIMTGGRRPEWAPLEASRRLTDDLLSLHYGQDFPKWSTAFQTGFSETGISILCGEAGTGKTSFLRHVMSSLGETHRFYFVPVDNFDLLTSGSLTNFWKAEQREHPNAIKVLVLEDAETLLRGREEEGPSPVSMILNLTDGLMTQFIKLHLVATLNCKRSMLDKALLRPGRLRFFRDFPRLSVTHATKIAQHYGLKLRKQSDYSLAEIFGSEKFAEMTSGLVKEKTSIGFAQS